MDKQLSEMTVTELKALAYDQIGILERSQQNLKFINAEIEKRSQEQEKKRITKTGPLDQLAALDMDEVRKEMGEKSQEQEAQPEPSEE